ncbi:3-aminobutyryl-CoA ammonia lyase [Kineosporia succinea]|uniref:3-aminobutyryl-CoA ammonia-lyase n=1 Tax=Kineosporia succinea TaxID=84632 RepID=A0ABT9P897_9ACTN|nr:hotdog domain-containing protein [Kineosporia succinea]MDP9828781.1 3-aminobutyryl-CoA ammonia-lyase [Kineosporia succinea]
MGDDVTGERDSGGSGGAAAADGTTGVAGAGDGTPAADPRLGLHVVHKRYISAAHAHYAGNLVDGAFGLACFGDVATEICIRTDGDEGLFASYSDVQFLAPIRAGDVLETKGTVTRLGRRSREIDFIATVVCRLRPDMGVSAAEVLAKPIVVIRAKGTVVVPGA